MSHESRCLPGGHAFAIVYQASRLLRPPIDQIRWVGANGELVLHLDRLQVGESLFYGAAGVYRRQERNARIKIPLDID